MAKTQAQKKAKKAKVAEYVVKYGHGKGLMEGKLNSEQKKNRMEKLVGPEIEKIKGYGIHTSQGVDWEKRKIKRGESNEWLNKELSEYPDDPNGKDKRGPHKILRAVIGDRGEATIHGVLQDSRITDSVERVTYSVDIPSDQELARLELKQIKQGKLKKISMRTRQTHIDNGDFDAMVDNEEIDTSDSEEVY